MNEKIKKNIKEILNGFLSILRIAISVCLMIGIFYGAYYYLNQVFTTKDAYTEPSFHSLEEDSIDVLTLGSSHAQYSFLSSFFNKDTGLYSYSLGSNCQPIKVSYLMLKEALKTQNPELVILEVYTATPTGHGCQDDSCFVMAAYEMTGDERRETFDYLDEEKAKEYQNEFLNNHNNWIDMTSISDLKIKKGGSVDSSFGYLVNWFDIGYIQNYWYAHYYPTTNEVSLYKEDEEALNNILALCKENDIELMLYYAPMESIDQENQDYRFAVWKWARENDVGYLDFVLLEITIDYRLQIHSDSGHAFINGAALMTSYISDYVNENYTFDSHRDIEEMNYLTDYDVPYKMLHYLSKEANPNQYVRILRNYNGLILMKYLNSGDKYNSSFIQELKDMGVSDNFSTNENYYVAIADGQILAESNIEIDIDYNGNNYKVSRGQISKNDEVLVGESFFSLVTFGYNEEDYYVKNIETIPSSWTETKRDVWTKGYDNNYNKID